MRSVRLQNSGHDGVGPEALCRAVLGLHLLGFRSWVRITGIQHRLEDTPTSVDEPVSKRSREGVRGRWKEHTTRALLELRTQQLRYFALKIKSFGGGQKLQRGIGLG